VSARAIEVFPAAIVGSVDDKSAVLLRTGAAALGMSIAEARLVSQRLARVADDVEYKLALRKLPQLSDDEARDAAEFFEAQQCPSDRSFR
jgi:hypothetical protein